MTLTVSEAVTVGAAVELSIALPEGARREPDAALPAIDLSNLAGARIVARRAFSSNGVSVRLLCAAAPASGWATGVEEIVLSRASQLAREALEREAPGGEVTRFEVAPQAEIGTGFEQRFSGVVNREGDSFAVRGRHWLGFAGEPRDAVVCTAVCTERSSGTACTRLVAETVPRGAWLEAPPPSLLARTLLAAATNPWAALVVLAGFSIALATVVIARRPRPRPSR